MQSSITEIFGENVFDDAVMQERLPKKVYAAVEADHQKRAVELDPGHRGCGCP